MLLYSIQASAASRVSGPALSRVCEMGIIPFPGSEPWAGLSPVTPFWVAQPTMEKEVSVPTAAAQNPADTATAEPVLEPPGSIAGSKAPITCPPRELYPFGMSGEV